MALGGGASGGGRRGRRGRRGPLTEINVTPLVDVMLVLLIIFMISAPLLTVGVPVELPKTEASAVETDNGRCSCAPTGGRPIRRWRG
jgi:biopolymer transport protein TolR